MAVEKVTDQNFEADVIKSATPVVVDFWAEWCGPCRMVAPILDEVSTDLAGKVRIVKLNVDENPQIASRFGIMSIPTMLLFKDGKIVSRQVGAAQKAKLVQWINSVV